MIRKIKESSEYALYDQMSLAEKDKIYGTEKESGISFFLASLLHARGIEKKEEIENFLYPKWEDLSDPFDFNDMKKVVQRIMEAISRNEKILIYSDYDTDGIPGGAILNDFFEKIEYKNFANFIPHRNRDGYGLTTENAQKISEGKIFDNFQRKEFFDDQQRFNNDAGEKNSVSNDEKEEEGKQKNIKNYFLPTLVVTIDCGISDTKGALILKEAGIDLIITDHHIAGDALPEALGIVNHKVEGEKYGDKNLCGAGIIFRVVQALFLEMRKEAEKDSDDFWKNIIKDIPEGWEKWLLDLASISTICDMVPLVGENRILVKYGQKVLAKTQRKGLNEIIKKSRINKQKISADDIGFMIGPRINAASRIDDPFLSFKALSEKGIEGELFAQDMEKINNRRKYLMAKIMKEAWKKIEERQDEKSKVIVMGSRDWPLGVVGLVAGKIADKYKKPAFVWGGFEGEKGDIIKGSSRSGGEVSIYSLMEKTKDQFVGYGGHQMAGGFELEFDKLHTLEEKLSENFSKAEKVKKELKLVDTQISLSDVHFNHYQEIEKLEPFGMKNPKPLFYLENIEIKKVRKFGKNNEHIELSFKEEGSIWVNSVVFFYKDFFSQEVYEKYLEIGKNIDIVASFELNQYNGSNSLRLKIENVLK